MSDADGRDEGPPLRTGSLLFDVFVLGQEVRRLLTAGMAGSPLRPEDYAMYSVVFDAEAITPTAMAARLSMPLTTVAEYVRAMEERGHARRIPNPRDGRSYLIVLSAAGLEAHRAANRQFEAVHAALVAALDEPEADARAHLLRLREAAQAAQAAQAAGVAAVIGESVGGAAAGRSVGPGEPGPRRRSVGPGERG